MRSRALALFFIILRDQPIQQAHAPARPPALVDLGGLKAYRASAFLAAVKHPQHDQALAVVTVTKDIGRVQNLQHDLAIVFTALYRSSELGVFLENLSFLQNFNRDDLCKMWVPILKKRREATEVGQCRGRPFEPQRFCQGLNAGVPHV